MSAASQSDPILGGESVVYLYTDIEGSTERYERAPRHMGDALLAHDTIVRDAIAACGGTLRDQAGDSVLSLFPVSADPLSCAMAIKRRLDAHDWSRVGGLRVRTAIHLGHGDRDRLAIKRTVALAQSAAPGQILVSEVARKATRRPPKTEFTDLGLCWLKASDAPLRLFDLHLEGEAPPFPPPKLARTGLQSVTEASAPIFGREHEKAALLELLTDQRTQVVSIVGLGGVGKSRLALHVAAIVAQTRRVHFLSFDEGSGDRDIACEIARALHLPLSAEAAPEAQVILLLRDRQVLLLLDSAEAIAGNVEFVGQLVATCPGVAILATSRQPLGVADEVVLRLRGFDTPSDEKTALRSSPAYLHFLAHARDAAPSFEIDEGDAAVFVDICRLLGGSPLGLQLCASWARLLSLEDMRGQLRADAAFLQHSAQNEGRHANMQAVLDASWRLLSLGEREVLARMSVFHSGCDAAAAAAIAGASAQTLRKLGGHGLIEADEGGRLTLHPLVRAHASQQLGEARADAMQRHSDYYLSFFRERMGARDFGSQSLALDEIEREFPNLREAWRVMVAANDLKELADVAELVFFFTVLRARFRDGERFFAESATSLRVGAYLQSLMANCLIHQGKVTPAREALHAARAHAEGTLTHGHIAQGFAKIAHLSGELEEAIARYEEAARVRVQAGDELGLGFTLGSWALALMQRGDVASARLKIADAEALFLKANNSAGMLIVHGLAGDVARRDGDLDAARSRYLHGLEIESLCRNTQLRIGLLLRVGEVAVLERGYQAAQAAFSEARSCAEAIGDDGLVARALNHSGACALARGESREAREAFLHALRIANALHIRGHQVTALLGLAEAKVALGESDLVDVVLATVASDISDIDRPAFERLSGRHSAVNANVPSQTLSELASFILSETADALCL